MREFMNEDQRLGTQETVIKWVCIFIENEYAQKALRNRIEELKSKEREFRGYLHAKTKDKVS